MRLTQRLLLGSLVVVAVLVAFVVAAVDQRLRARITEESTRQLAREARLVATQWVPGADPDALADAAGAALGERVTLVDTTGRVVGDSEFDGVALAGLENHIGRPEVAAALRGEVGSARRVSASAGDDEIYVAVRAPLGIARVSLATRSVDEVFARARRDVYFAGLVAMLAALALSYLFSRAVSRPIVELRDVAQALAAGDLSRRPALSAPGEVGDLAVALHRLAEQLGARLAALQAEESLLVELFDSLNEGAVAVAANRQVVRINDVGRRLVHAAAQVPFPVDHLPRDHALREALDAALAGTAVGPVESTIAGRTVSLTARPLTGGGAVLAVFDLTPVRRLEAVRRDFVANVSHELRTPLTIIGGFAETLVDDDVPPDGRRRFAETILANTRRMQRIVDDLLDLSRIESGGWVPNPVTVDVRAIVGEAIGPAKAVAEAKGVAFVLAIDPAATAVHADPTALRQVVANLVENALRHTSAGQVTVFTQPGERGVWLGVRDTGVGIAPEHVPRIFERFYRVDTGRSRGAGGTGLGLAIVRHLVEAHAGRVQAESAVGEGTTIRVFFPLPSAAPTA
jgi:signal transduction histidine kinase